RGSDRRAVLALLCQHDRHLAPRVDEQAVPNVLSAYVEADGGGSDPALELIEGVFAIPDPYSQRRNRLRPDQIAPSRHGQGFDENQGGFANPPWSDRNRGVFANEVAVIKPLAWRNGLRVAQAKWRCLDRPASLFGTLSRLVPKAVRLAVGLV